MTHTHQQILVSCDERQVATITLNRPEKRNAFDDHMITEFRQVIHHLSHDPNVRIIVIQSTGDHFSAGGDLDWLRQTIHYNREENIKDAMNLAHMMYDLYHVAKPTIAVIQGPAYGGAVGLIACCQLAIAASTVTFCFSEVKLGLLPSVISPYIINAIGFRRARAYFTTAEVFDAETAREMGLCHMVVSKDALAAKTEKLISQLLNNGPRATHALGPFLAPFQPIDISLETISRTADMIAALRISNEGQEGLTAFLEKRPPRWSKRSQ
jgi:methylglutaconyl-CoA hydratase